MNFNQLRYAVAVDEAASISKAAQRLFVSQPAVSNAIKDLEQELSITIFERTPNGTTVTQEGASFMLYARSVIDQFDDITRKYKESGKKLKQTVRITVQPLLEPYIAIIKNLPLILNREKDYIFSMKYLGAAEVFEDVSNSRADLGVIFTLSSFQEYWNSLFASKNLNYVPLDKTLSMYIAIGVNHPLASRKSLHAADMTEYTYIDIFNSNPTSVQGVAEFEFLSSLGLTDAASTVYVGDYYTAFEIIRRGRAFSIFSAAGKSDILWFNDTIKGYRIDTRITYEGGVLMRRQHKLSAIEEEFIECLKESAFEEGYRP